MKKRQRLVFVLAMLLAGGTTLAQASEVVVNGAKYSVLSDNLFVNGSFDDGVSGWKTIGYTTDAVESNFTLTASGGYDGGAYITTNGGAASSETTLRQSVAVEEGSTYLFTIYTSGNTPADNNLAYNALFQMTDSATENGVLTQFNWASGSSTEWTVTNLVFTAAEGNPYVGVRFGWNSGASFDGVQLYKVEYVGVDDSELTSLIATAKETLATYDEGTDWYTSLSEAIATAEAAGTTTSEEISAAVTALQTAMDEAASEAALAEARANAPYEDGNYYILNEETGYYVGGGNSWGTQASLLARPQAFTATLQNDGSYLLTSFQGGVCLGTNCYVDASNSYYTTWTLVASDSEGKYTLVNAAGNYLMAGETGAALTIETLDDASTATLWKFVSVTEGMDEASVEAPVDVTGLVTNPDFKRGGSSYWTATSYDGTESAGNYTYSSTNNYTNNIIESWRSSNGFKVQQTLTDLPAGLYGLSGQGFYYNYDESVDSTLSELYADEEANVLPTRDDDALTSLATAYSYMVADASKYAINTVYFRVNEGDDINIGVRKEGTYGWTTFTHTKLIYLGNNSLITNVLTDLADSLQTALAAANALTDLAVSDESTQTALAAVIAEAEADDYLLTAKRSTVEATLAALAEAVAAVEASNAEYNSDNTIADGNYYLKNVATGRFLAAGNDWGTHASALEHGEVATLAQLSDGTYTLESRVSNGGTNYYLTSGSYMDGSATGITFTSVGNGAYTLGVDGTLLIAYDDNTYANFVEAEADSYAQWQLISEADMLASLSEATADAPADATFLIKDPNFGRNNRDADYWTMVADNQNMSDGDVTNCCAESYHTPFTLSQSLTLPNGVYKLEAQGFYRQDGSDNDNLPVFYANDETSTFPLLGSDSSYPSSMSGASAAFTNGEYAADPIYLEVTDGTMTIGAKLETNTTLWCIWDNFELTYYGADADVSAVKFASLIEELAAQRATAAEYAESENVSDAVKTTVSEALTATADVEETEEALTAAIETLSAANSAAATSADQKEAIDGMKTLMANNNVATAEATEAYSTLIDTYETAWNAGTLTETVQNPYDLTSWHASLDFDDYLLSAWTINDVQAEDFNTSLYINTWSTEGLSDGSDFVTPFYEYWVSDASTLSAATIQAVVDSLAPGTYDVTAEVRVRLSDSNTSETPSGITFTANDVTVDAAAGTVVAEGSQLYLQTIDVTATVTADEDSETGSLTLTFSVEDGNNISWLSFRNVSYTLNAAADDDDNTTITIADGDYYILNEETGYYVGGGNSWGTQASLLARPQAFTATLQDDGSYMLSTYQGNLCLGANGYVDAVTSTSTTWTLKASGSEGECTLVNAEGNYLIAGELGAALSLEVPEDLSTATLWKFVSVTEGMDEATVDAPVDVTGLVKNPDFKRGGTSYWTVTSYDGTEDAANFTFGASSNYTNNIMESWCSSNGFKVQQTLTDLPAGLYGLSGQGFYHNYDEATDATVAELFGDEECAVLPTRDDDELTYLPTAYSYMVEDATKYAIDIVYFRVNEGDSINIGVRKEGTYSWTTFTHTKLIYLGDNSLITNVLTDLADSLQTALEAAKALTDLEVSDESTQTALAAVIAEAEADDYLLTAKRSTVEATLAALAEAMAAVEASNAELTDGVSSIEAETEESDYGYTLNGARAVKGSRGIVIKNGKKVVVK